MQTNITNEMIAQYPQEGYFILESVMTDEQV